MFAAGANELARAGPGSAQLSPAQPSSAQLSPGPRRARTGPGLGPARARPGPGPDRGGRVNFGEITEKVKMSIWGKKLIFY